MVIIEPIIFRQFPKLKFGFNSIIDAGSSAPYNFNVSLSVGDDEQRVQNNREKFYKHLGLTSGQIAFQKQVHGDTVTYTDNGGYCGESDALITDKVNVALAVSTADCSAVFIYDPVKKIIAGIHSGWRGTALRIVEKTLIRLKEEYQSNPDNMFVYLAPSISMMNYEVGDEVASLFDSKYTEPYNGKFLLDVAGVNYDMILEAGIPQNHIQKSDLCTYASKDLLHSYRRGGVNSGRAFGIISMKD